MVWVEPELRKAFKVADVEHEVTVQELAIAGHQKVADNVAKYAKTAKAARQERH